MADHADKVVSDIIGRWTAGFRKLDSAALSSLYSKNAFFFGSNPRLYRGRDGAAAYFDGLPRWESTDVQFSDIAATSVNPDLVNMAGTASFFLGSAEPTLSVKITWVIAREDGDWKIVCHHVSSKAPLI